MGIPLLDYPFLNMIFWQRLEVTISNCKSRLWESFINNIWARVTRSSHNWSRQHIVLTWKKNPYLWPSISLFICKNYFNMSNFFFTYPFHTKNNLQQLYSIKTSRKKKTCIFFLSVFFCVSFNEIANYHVNGSIKLI